MDKVKGYLVDELENSSNYIVNHKNQSKESVAIDEGVSLGWSQYSERPRRHVTPIRSHKQVSKLPCHGYKAFIKVSNQPKMDYIYR